MAHKKKRKLKKAKKHYLFLIGAIAIITVIAFLLAFIFISHNYIFVPENEIYVSSENPQQGDTVLVKVNSIYPLISGFFDGKKLEFFRNAKYLDWSGFLGIDAEMEPGTYKIIVETSGKIIEKEIRVEKKDFSSSKMITPQATQEKGYTDSKVVTNIRNNDNPALSEVLKDSNLEPYFNSSFFYPLKNVEKSGFGFGDFLEYSNYRIQHLGIDLRAGLDTKVYVVNNGKVVMAKELSNYGKTIVIDHGLGIFSLYLHLDEFKIAKDDMVKKGQIIGLSGDTGYTAGPHLHFSMRDNGARVDPMTFIEKTSELKQSTGLAGVAEAFSRFLNNFMLK